jgi:chromosome segregation ATPase
LQVPGSDTRLLEAELQAKQAVIAEKETVIARLRSSHAVHRSGAARDMSRHIQQLQGLSTAALLASSNQEATSSQAPSNPATTREVAVKLQALTHKISDTASMLANDSDLESQLAELQQMVRQMQVQGAQSMMMAVTEKDECIAQLQSALMHLKSQMEASSALMLTLQCTVQSNGMPAAAQLQHALQQ